MITVQFVGNMIKAVIFDFDGVIADTETIHFRAFNKVLEPYGVLIEEDVYWDKYLGYTDKEAYENINIDYDLGFNDEKISWMIDEKAVVFDEFVRADGAIIQGVTEFIMMLKKQLIPMAICSGAISNDIESVFDSTKKRTGVDMKEFFKVVISADDVVNGKPHPEGYILTLDRLNELTNLSLKPEQCLVIEDSYWGIKAAKQAQMKVLAVANSYPKDELEKVADIAVETLKELKLEHINQKLC